MTRRKRDIDKWKVFNDEVAEAEIHSRHVFRDSYYPIIEIIFMRDQDLGTDYEIITIKRLSENSRPEKIYYKKLHMRKDAMNYIARIKRNIDRELM